MTQNPITVSPLESIEEAYGVLIKNGIHQVPVLSDGSLVGIITDRDLRTALYDRPGAPNVKVSAVMSREPISITDDLKIVEAAKVISKERFNALPVVDSRGELIGIVTVRDILDGLINLFEISK